MYNMQKNKTVKTEEQNCTLTQKFVHIVFNSYLNKYLQE